MENKVRWQREDGGAAVPYMFEQLKSGAWKWVRYTNSRMSQPDKGMSKGYASWLYAIKAGYIVDSVVLDR